MKFLSGKINDLLGLPISLRPGEFYSIQDGATSKLYFCDVRGNLLLLSNDASALGTFVNDEVPSGTINGVNTIFTLAHTPVVGSEEVYLNGLKMTILGDYTIVGAVMTMINIPYPGDKFLVNYRY